MDAETMGLLAVGFWAFAGGAVLTIAVSGARSRRMNRPETEQAITDLYRAGWLAGADWAEHVSGQADAHRRGFEAGCTVQYELAEREMAIRCRACAAAARRVE